MNCIRPTLWPHSRRVATLPAVLLVAVMCNARSLGAEWAPVKDVSLALVAGSPLDFRRLSPDGPAGSLGRVVVGDNGNLAFEPKPGTPVRFGCASLAISPATGGFPDHPAADLFAEQLRVHGYNLARFHYIEATVMTGRDRDFDFDPVALDNFHYFLAALKKQGVYWNFDVLSSDNGAIGGVYPHRWINQHDLKTRVYFDETAQQHWRLLAKKLYAAVNPYTGSRILDDPALVSLITVNENPFGYLAILRTQRKLPPYPPELEPRFSAWLKTKYRTNDALASAWGMLDRSESLDAGRVHFPASHRDRGPRMRDTQLFLSDIEQETFRWMLSALRELGYRGLATDYDNMAEVIDDRSRTPLPMIDMHNYHDLAQSAERGGTITQTSSLADGARYVRGMAGTRFLGRPFTVTEYGQPFWNAYRREAGLVAPALSALQNWDFACLHAEPAIDLSLAQNVPRKRAIHPYGVGVDPVTRAGETVAALVFHRADVAPAKNLVGVRFSEADAERDDGLASLPDDVTYLSLLTRVGLVPAVDAAKPAVPRLIDIAGTEIPSSPVGRALARTVDTVLDRSTQKLANRVAQLREWRVLDAQNATNPNAGIFESDTREVFTDTGRRLFRVVTPRTEAVVFDQLPPEYGLGAVTIRSTTGPALVSVSALDDQPIPKSGRLLVVMATDAENTDMAFTDETRRTLTRLGRMPPRIRCEQVRLRLDHSDAGSLLAWSLKLNGERGDQIPIAVDGATASLMLDNCALSHGPTTFFTVQRAR